MHSKVMVILGFLMLGMVSAGPVFPADRVMELLPDFELPIPEEPGHANYLGVQNIEGETFRITDIDADIVLIELFSMYCPFCQEEAPAVNELYQKMQALGTAGPNIKIVGIGASNSPFEVDHFRNTFDIEFPLFPDQDMSIYKALSGAGTPGFIGVRFDEGKKGVIVLRQSGGFYSTDDFLAELIEYAARR
ncbi:MAG: TlpA family protein disulfide reductase [Desulfofustis sp.]|jgi:peroxiredoxin|nr:TlpA family protein disulfide reductase [Desulfofustis sp.]